MTQKNHNPREHFKRKDQQDSTGHSKSGAKYSPESTTNYTPYIVGGVILLVILVAIIL